jgi:3-deoxy-D-manno-octulosonate 8-phosphate phosphatase (KDO 8-P phosphatase)
MKHKIDLFVYDFDGVMTDNRVLLSEEGLESVYVNRGDGLAISIFKKMGFNQVIISTESNQVVERRGKKLDIPTFFSVDNKSEFLISYAKSLNIELKNCAYIGNDINDLEAMKLVGHKFCPADASNEIKQISSYVTSARGGYGVIREVLEILTS